MTMLLGDSLAVELQGRLGVLEQGWGRQWTHRSLIWRVGPVIIGEIITDHVEVASLPQPCPGS